MSARRGPARRRALLWAVGVAALGMLGAGGFAGAQSSDPDTITAVVAGDGSLTVVWDTPAGVSEDSVTAYDLRYIDTSTDETVDSNWTEVSSAWTSGPRHYVIDGLTNDTSYDVQVRVLTPSVGDWSQTVAQTPGDAADNRASAVELPLDVPVTGIVGSASDVDVYKVTLSKKLGLVIYTTGDTDTAGRLLNSTGTKLASENEAEFLATGDNFAIWGGSLQAGTYYIEVSSNGGSTGSYVLHTTGIVDSWSFNDATPIEVDSTTLAILHPRDSTDYFKLTLSQRTDLLIILDSFDQSIHGKPFDTLGQVFDSDREEIASNDDGYLRSDRDSVIRVHLDAGTYYIGAESYHSSTVGPYQVLVSEVKTDPGSTQETAAPLALEGFGADNIDPANDADYFSIEVDTAGLINIRASSTTAALSGELLDNDGGSLGEANQDTRGGLITLDMKRTLAAGTYYLRIDTSGWTSDDSKAATGAYAVAAFKEPDRCDSSDADVDDFLYGCQWNLSNTGQEGGTAGEDINVEDAWETTLGSGMAVSVVDSRVDPDHEDLVDNYDASNSFDYRSLVGRTARPGSHGTAVAGLVAGRDNSAGIRGVAPRATIRSYNVLQYFTDANKADAMAREAATTAVSNNSWGPADTGRPARAPRIWELAVETGLSDGQSGLGTFYAWAGGNGSSSAFPDEDNSNLDEFANFYGVTAVCAVNHRGVRTYYSEKGANLWVCAPSNDPGTGPGITTTATGGEYVDHFGGTSAATPQVSGVAALVRSANTALGWRDVKLILAGSARKNDPDDSGWETGAAQYESASDSYEFNHSYGFGVVDADAAVELAQGWTNVAELRSQTVEWSGTPVVVGPSAASTFTDTSVQLGPEVEFVEFVEVKIVIDATRFRDLEMELESPQGAVSELLVPYNPAWPFSVSLSKADGYFRLGSARHLGEDASGEWTLRLRDRVSGGTASTLHSWSITVYGHGTVPSPATITSVDGNTNPVTVSWEAPEHDGESAVNRYDLRYVRGDEADKDDDSNWTELGDVWSSGSLSHRITSGLDSSVVYDFQVRAVNTAGAGNWSKTAGGGVGTNAPQFGSAESGMRNVAENTAAGEAVGALVAATDPDADDVLTYSAGGDDAAAFALDAATGQIRTSAALDFEDRETYTFEVTATDKTGLNDTITVTVSVTDVNEVPSLTFWLRGGDVVENEIPLSVLFAFNDPEGATAQWSLSGPDSGLLTVNDTDLDPFWLGYIGTHAQLEFLSPADFEDPADDDGDNVYDVTLEASDGTNTARARIETTVTDEDEAPELTGIEASDYPEGGTGAVHVYQAEDPEEATIRWSVSGPDGADFSIAGGVLAFRVVPDFEVPHDHSSPVDGIVADNVYEVTVHAGDGGLSSSLDVTVTVTNVDEAGEVTLSSSQPLVETEVTASLTDPDDVKSAVRWSWERSSDRVSWSVIGGADSHRYTPVDPDDLDQYLRAVASYRDGHGSGKSAQADTADAVGTQPPVNSAPQFPETETGARRVAENTAANTSIGAAVAAGDLDRDALTYTLGGADASSFQIVSSSGQLRTSGALDFESKSSYSVTVSVSDGKDPDDNPDSVVDDTVAVTVDVDDVDEVPEFSDDADDSPAFAENDTDTVARYRATDPEDEDLVWSLPSGADAGFFEVSASGGLSFKVPPDFEARADANRDNSYRVRVAVSDATNTSHVDVAVTVSDVNEEPVLAGGAASVQRRVLENTAANTSIGAAVAASDPERDTLTYTLEGSDESSFEIVSSSGRLRVKDDLDFESKSSYSVTVLVSDGKDADGNLDPAVDDTVSVTVEVDDVDEAPVFRDDADDSPAFAENDTGTVARYVATDPEGVSVTWSLSGTDADDLEISPSGALSFKASPDFENRADSNRDNEYRVRVTASDGTETEGLDVEVTVDNVDEPGTVHGMPTQPQQNTTVSVSLSDPDGSVSSLSWEWQRSNVAPANRDDLSDWETITGATTRSYTPTADDEEWWLRATASYHDRERANKTARAVSANATQLAPVINRDPAFPPSETGQRNVLENTPAERDVGAAVEATDPDLGDILTYTLHGSDSAAFEIEQSSGQLLTNDALDRETKATYRFTVRAEDPSGKSDQTQVTVTIDDVAEAPALSGPTAANFPENRTTEAARYQAQDPERATIVWSLSGDDADRFTIAAGVLRFNTPPDYEDPAGAAGNDYRVDVVAADGPPQEPATLESTISVTVTVTPVDEAPDITGAANVEHPENTTIVGAYSAQDPEGHAFVWSLQGTDKDLFDFADDGTLSFKAAPDHETRNDADRNNRYQVTLTATAGLQSSTLPVTVTVTNVDDPGTITFSNVKPAVGSRLSAKLTDPDGRVTALTWLWERSTDRIDWTEIDGATSSRYTPTNDDETHYLKATATYTDPHGPSKTAVAASLTAVSKARTDRGPASSPGPGGGGGGGGGGAGGGGGDDGSGVVGEVGPVVEIRGATHAAAGAEVVLTAAVRAGGEIGSVRWTATGPDGFKATGDTERFAFVPPTGGTYTATVTVDATDTQPTLTATTTLTVLGDIAGHHFAKEIAWLAQQGITAGCTPYAYCPARLVTRAQMAVFLVRALGLEPVEAPAGRFADVAPDAWHAGYVERLAHQGITAGCNSTNPQYCPGSTITRAQMALFLQQAFNLPATDVDQPSFTDIPTDHYAHKGVEAVKAAGITSGCSHDPPRYCGAAPVTRAQMAAFLNAALNPNPQTTNP